MKRDDRRQTKSAEQLTNIFSNLTVEQLLNTSQQSTEMYRYYLTMALTYMPKEFQWKVLLKIIQQDKQQRIKEEIELIMHVTGQLKFFQQLNSKQRNLQNNLHYKVAANLEYEFFPKGSIIFKQDDPPVKFYIILKGSVNIYLKKDQQTVIDQISDLQQIQVNCKQKTTSQVIEQLQNLKQKKHQQNSELHHLQGEENYKAIEQQIGGIPPESIQDYEFYFTKGVFKHRYLATLSAGNMFGELGILLNKGRTASIVAKTDTELAVLSSAFYRQLLKDIDLKKIQDRVNFFQKYFFQNMPKQLLVKYSYNFERLKLRRGDTVYSAGDKSKSVYLIKKGEIVFTKSIEGQQKQMAILGVGQIFGDVEMLENQPRSQSATCQSEMAKLYFLDRDIFFRVLKDNPNLKRQFAQSTDMKKDHDHQREAQIRSMINKVKTRNLSYLNPQIEYLSVVIRDPVQKKIIRDSNKNLFRKIQVTVQNRKKILESKGETLEREPQTKLEDLVEMRKVLDYHYDPLRHSSTKSIYKVPEHIKQKVVQQHNFMQSLRSLYKTQSQAQNQSQNSELFTKNFDKFKTQYLEQERTSRAGKSLFESSPSKLDNTHPESSVILVKNSSQSKRRLVRPSSTGSIKSLSIPQRHNQSQQTDNIVNNRRNLISQGSTHSITISAINISQNYHNSISRNNKQFKFKSRCMTQMEDK